MKKIVYIIAALLLSSTSGHAQKLNATKVPATVKASFSKSHPTTSKVSWSKEEKNFEAEFSLNGKQNSEVYTAEGTFVESEVEIKVSELPSAIKINLRNQKVAEAAKITKANGTVVYEAEVKGKDLLFDAIGNPIKL